MQLGKMKLMNRKENKFKDNYSYFNELHTFVQIYNIMIPVYYPINQIFGIVAYYNVDKGQAIPDVSIEAVHYSTQPIIEITSSNIDELL